MTARELHALRGYRSAAAWLRDTRPDADSTDARLATRLRGYPGVTAALDGCDLSLSAARKILSALSSRRLHLDQPDGLIDHQPGEQVVSTVVGHVVDLVAGCLLGLHDDHPLLTELLARTTAINASAEAGDTQLQRLEAAFVLLATHVPIGMLPACLEELVLAVVPSMLEDLPPVAASAPASPCSSRAMAAAGTSTATSTCSAANGSGPPCGPKPAATATIPPTRRRPPRSAPTASTRTTRGPTPPRP